MLRTRAIQIGLSRSLSEQYVQESIISVEDVTNLAVKVGHAHKELAKNPKLPVMQSIFPYLPIERPYIPHVEQDLALAPGESAQEVAWIGLGKVKRVT